MPKHKIKYLTGVFPESPQMRIKYKDVFDLKEFYSSLHEWLLEHDWKDEEEDGDRWESYYGERVGKGGMREIWMRWRIKKDAENAKFLEYMMDINMHCVGITSTEIVKDGMKLKADKGEIEMFIKPYIHEIYREEMEKEALLKHFVEVFRKRVYRRTLEDRKKELYHEGYALANWIKQWFKMKRYLPYDETRSFYPSMAWPSHLKE